MNCFYCKRPIRLATPEELKDTGISGPDWIHCLSELHNLALWHCDDFKHRATPQSTPSWFSKLFGWLKK